LDVTVQKRKKPTGILLRQFLKSSRTGSTWLQRGEHGLFAKMITGYISGREILAFITATLANGGAAA
jgi:hypothetical protein